MKSNKKKVAVNILCNYVATIVPLLVLQLFLLPKVNSILSEENYGFVLTIISLVTMVTDAAGISLNNVRLITDIDYSEENYKGDFNFIFIILVIPVSFAVLVVSAIYMGGISVVDLLGIFAMTVLFMGVRYYIVGFLIHLNYTKLMIGNLIQAVGYFIGYFIFKATLYWQWIYIVGYALNLIYIFIRTSLIREGIRRTPFFKITVKKESILLASSLLAGSITYFDKLLLYPILGGVFVSIYYVATLFGKLLTTAMNPISNIILSYFSRKKEYQRKTVKKMLLSSVIAGAIGYAICLAISRPILGYLYPNIIDDSMQYVFITLLTAVIDMQYFVLRPVILRFYNTTWQIAISSVNIVIYIGLSLIMLSICGMMGFCIGVCIASTVRFLMVFIIYLKSKTNIEVAEEEELK